MGILWALSLRLAGVDVIGVVEVDDARREHCEESFGLPALELTQAESVEADYVIDATGAPSAMEAAVWRCRPGGTVMFFGVAGEGARVSVPPFRLYQREIRILTSMAVLHTYGDAVDFVGQHADLLRPMVTDILPLGSFAEAVDDRRGEARLKVALDPTMG
jgi:threonine dehydrogenase-like Zn-dependent dehydrogenase